MPIVPRHMPLLSGVWLRILSISVIFLFVALSDAILSFWTPAFIEEKLGNAVLMGAIMSFSSVVGLGADLLLPQLIQGIHIRKLIALSLGISLLFAVIMFASTLFPFILIFMVGMAAWGIYYEILGFTRQQFVADATPHKLHASALALIMIFLSLAYTVGPLIAEVLDSKGEKYVIIASILLISLAFILSQFLIPKSHAHVHVVTKNLSLWNEFKHWKTLFRVVWPMLIISIMLGVIDAAFWTTGTVYSAHLSEVNILGNFFVPAYMFPSLFMGFVIMKLNIYEHKKKLSQMFFVIAGLLLALLGFSESVVVMLLCVFASSIFLSLVHPLVDAVYADVISRMGRQEWHLIGLCNSSWSLAYIIGPLLAGFISSLVGEKQTFAILGIAAVIVSVILLLVTKRKLVLPQAEIKTWK